jgi:hypothetical protein
MKILTKWWEWGIIYRKGVVAMPVISSFYGVIIRITRKNYPLCGK